MPHPGHPVKGIDLQDGTRYVAIHFSADSTKGQEWEQKKARGIPERSWKREMGMHDDVYEGEPVFSDYSDVRHCPLSIRESGIPIFPNSVYIGGWDNGLTPAFSMLQITPMMQVQCILEVTSGGDDPMETFGPKVLNAIARRIPGAWDEVYHIGDPSIWNRTATTGDSPGLLAKRKFGINIRRASNVWGVRQSAVTWLLTDQIDAKTERFILDGKYCPIMRIGFQGAYQFEISPRGDTIGPGRILTEPLKNGYSHCLAAGTMVATSRGNVPIERVIVGDLVQTRMGLKPVTKSWLSGVDQEVFEVKLSNGSSLVGTSDHLVMANSHWTKIDSLQCGNIVECLEAHEQLLFPSLFNLTAKLFENIQKAPDYLTELIIKAMMDLDECIYIGTFGNRLMVPSQRGFMSITKMRTLTTMFWKTWNVYPRKITLGCGIESELVPAERFPLNWLMMRQRHGILVPRGWRGTRKMPLNLRRNENTEIKNVQCVVKNSKLDQYISAKLGSAECYVKPKLVGLPVLSHTSEVGSLAPVSVVTVSKISRSNVYDLTVEDAHEFYANGILVHNCHDSLQAAAQAARKFCDGKLALGMGLHGDTMPKR